MRADERKKGIADITKGHLYSNDGKGKRLRYKGQVYTFVEYEIPMNLIVYNVENGRIASLVKSFTREHSSLNPERENDSAQIAKFLYESNDHANKQTLKDLAENGQLESGIITSDGVIVDGNRRASLMRRILDDDSFKPEEKARCEKFRAIVLPEDADDKEILRLETTYQMGTDEKVGYNPIEKYLHARDMKDKGFSLADISKYMGLKSQTDVQELLDVMVLIDDYLENYDYSGIYTRLPKGFEDDLLKLNTSIKKIRNGHINWIPTDKLDETENDLKCISFDYIRLNAKSPEGFDYRAIAATANNNFLANENVWGQFVDSWQKATSDVEEEDIDSVLSKSQRPGDTDRLLEERDNKWRKHVREGLMEGFSDAKNIIDNQKEAEKPAVLLKRAINALEQIKPATNLFEDTANRQSLTCQINKIEELCAALKDWING